MPGRGHKVGFKRSLKWPKGIAAGLFLYRKMTIRAVWQATGYGIKTE